MQLEPVVMDKWIDYARKTIDEIGIEMEHNNRGD